MIKTVSILGLGLIGGSIAKALRQKTEVEKIYAYSINKNDINLAIKDGTIDKGFTDIESSLLDVDLIAICTPVKVSIEILDLIYDKINVNTIITDVGSTKSAISDHAKKLGIKNFIGSHPMAGSEKSGYQNSLPHLFENAFFVIGKEKDTKDDKLKDLISLISAIDAIPIILTPKEHDFAVAAISHLPHIAASSLVNATLKLTKENESIKTLIAGGFKDLTRIASSSPQMWENICTLNKDNIVKILDLYIDEIEEFKKTLENSDNKNLIKYFKQAKKFRDSIEDSKTTQQKYYDITVDIPDIPGSLAKVATLLSDAGINIKNISVPANREFQEGCLLVSFSNEKTRIHALSVLNKNELRATKNYEQ